MSKPPSKPSPSRLKQSLGQGGRGRRRAAASRAVEQEKAVSRKLPEHARIPSAPAEVLTTLAEIEAFCAEARSAGEVAYDTEFIGEESYIPKICLVQLATPQRVVLIDPIQEAPLEPVWSLLADPEVRVLVHSGLQDLVPIWRETGAPATNVLDTQVAAGFADRSFPISLFALVDEFVGITLDKSYTFTRWDQRPLRSGHLEYAADDVRFLFVIADALAAMTAERGHDAKVAEECQSLVDPKTYTPDPVHRMQRAVGNRKFNRRQRTALMELLTLRDHIAQVEDLPPRSVLKDEVCARVAKDMPKAKDALLAIKHFPRPVVETWGDAILDLLSTVRKMDTDALVGGSVREESNQDRSRIDALHAFSSLLCWREGIDSGVGASRAEISRFYLEAKQGQRPVGVLDAGWRSELLGEPLFAMLKGETSLTFRWSGGPDQAEKPPSSPS